MVKCQWAPRIIDRIMKHESTSALILTDAMEKSSQKDIGFGALEVFQIWTGTATQKRQRGPGKRDKERIVGRVKNTEQTSEEEEVWLKMKATDQVRGERTRKRRDARWIKALLLLWMPVR